MDNSLMKKPNSMAFVDNCLDDEHVDIIEQMVNYHIDKNYREVRNIILGYDSKNNGWKSKYGEILEKKLSTKDQVVTYTSPYTYSFFMNSEKFTKQGMIFYDDEVYNNVRFHADESIKRVLDVLFTISDRVIDYRHIIDIIITEWNLKNIRDSISPSKINIDPEICGDLYYLQLEVRENAWKELRSISKTKGMVIRDSFKQAVIGFLEDRSDMLKD